MSDYSRSYEQAETQSAVVDSLAPAFQGRLVQIWPEPNTFYGMGGDGQWHRLYQEDVTEIESALTTPIYEYKGK